MPLTATISSYTEASDSRASARHTLRLEVAATPSEAREEVADRALIYNLSTKGLLLETVVALVAGDMLVVSLPEVGPIAAEVIWARGGFAGCKFEQPVPAMAVSAARLRAQPLARPDFADPDAALQTTSGYDYQPETEEGSLIRAVTIGSLILAFGIAITFVIALLSFPFSTQ
jgi:hypothetical protein